MITTVPYAMTAPLELLGVDWWAEGEGNPALTIQGGGLEVNQTWMNYIGTETATINITAGGYMRSLGFLQMANTVGGTSQINIDSGFLYTPNLLFGAGTSNIDLEPGGVLYLAGDQTANVAGWIGAGLITGGNGTLGVGYDLTSLPGTTAVYAVVPEPAALTVLLLGLAGVSRRRRR